MYTSDSFSRSLFESSPDCVKIIDADGRLLQMNANGLCAMEIDNFALFEGSPWCDMWPPEAREELVEALACARAGRVARFQRQCPTNKGTDKWWDVLVAPIRDANGTVIRFVSVSRDITDLKRAELQVREAEEQFRTLADNIPQLAWIADAGTDGQVQWFNKSWLDFTGASLEGMQGSGWRSVHHPDHAERVIMKFVHHVQEGLDWEDTFPLRGKDGQYRWFLSRMNVIRSKAGSVVRIFGTNTDITEQRAMATQLQQQAAKLSAADRRKDDFLATLAHELRNPLAPIRNSLRVMRLAPDNPATVELAVSVMERQLGQMVRLVDDLLDLSRINNDKLELRREPVDLATVILNAVESSRSLIDNNGLQLTIAMPDRPIILNADLTRLAQVFLNLLNNAAKFTERGGMVSLSVEQQYDHAVVNITDTGVGIAASHLPGIFEMFAQVKSPLERSQGGLGIGLTLVRRLVELHEGQVEVRSPGPGCGSTFTVRLPVVLVPTIAPRPASGDEHKSLPESQYRVLVVDDNQDAANSLATMLMLAGHDTQAVYDGAAAIDTAATYLPHVLLLDIGLPGINGYEVARYVRQQSWGKAMVLLALTGWGQDEDRQRSRQAGFDHHLVKPVDPLQLTKLLNACVLTLRP